MKKDKCPKCQGKDFSLLYSTYRKDCSGAIDKCLKCNKCGFLLKKLTDKDGNIISEITAKLLSDLGRFINLSISIQKLLKQIELYNNAVSRDIICETIHLTTELTKFNQEGANKITGRYTGKGCEVD